MANHPHILITGTSRGIGLGLVKVFADAGWTVHAVARTLTDNAQLNALSERYGERLQLIECDLVQPEAAQIIKQAIGQQKLRAMLLNAGISGPEHQDPKQTTEAVTGQLFYINAVAPVALAQELAEHVEPDGVIAFTSSQMGSLQLNLSQQIPLYGASKAALNSLLLSWSGSFERLPWSLLAIHPGWVRTDMGGPGAILSVEQSAEGIAQVIKAHSGRNHIAFIDYADKSMPW